MIQDRGNRSGKTTRLAQQRRPCAANGDDIYKAPADNQHPKTMEKTKIKSAFKFQCSNQANAMKQPDAMQCDCQCSCQCIDAHSLAALMVAAKYSSLRQTAAEAYQQSKE